MCLCIPFKEQPGDWILIGGGVYSGLEAAVDDGEVTEAVSSFMVRSISESHLRNSD